MADDLLGRLRDGRALDSLAALIVDETLARPIDDLIDPAAIAELVRALPASDETEARWARWLSDGAVALAAEARPLISLLPAAMANMARELAALPFTPRRETVMAVLDREPVRVLLRAQVLAMLVDFARRAASPITDNPIARGLGGLSRRAFGKSSSGKLGALASAVTGEVERQADRRASEFADTAVAEVLGGLADDLADAGKASEQAAVRGAIVDGVLALSPADLVQPLAGNLAAFAGIVRRTLATWSAAPGFDEELGAVVGRLVAGEIGRPLGELLHDLGLREVVVRRGREVVRRRLGALVASDAFARWLDGI